MPFLMIRNDITKVTADAIVNPEDSATPQEQKKATGLKPQQSGAFLATALKR